MAKRALYEQAEQCKEQHVAKQVPDAAVQEHRAEHAADIELREADHPALAEGGVPQAVELGATFAPRGIASSLRCNQSVRAQICQKRGVRLQYLHSVGSCLCSHARTGEMLERFAALLVIGMRSKPVAIGGKFPLRKVLLGVVVERTLLHSRVARLQEREHEHVGENQRHGDEREILTCRCTMQWNDQHGAIPKISAAQFYPFLARRPESAFTTFRHCR